jgi:cytochrome P450
MAMRQVADLPGPGRLPLIGNAHQLRPDRLHQSAEAWADRYGPVYRFDLGRRRVVVISDVDVVNDALRDRPDGFRRWREILEITEEIGQVGVFSAEGDDWRRMRRLVVTALNSNHLQRYFEVVTTCTGRLHRRLQQAALEGRPFEIGTALSAFAVDVTSALAFGHDLNTLERGDDALQEHLHRVFHMTNRRIFLPVRYWRYFKLPADRALDRSMVEIEKAVMTFIEETRERVAAHPELREEPRNFLESMVAAEEGTFSDEDIIGNVFTLLLAGEDTTSHSMAWTIWSMARRPEIQARWAEEASQVLGEQPYATEYETVDDFRYGEAVLRESMRLTPVVPVTGLEPLADTEIEGCPHPRRHPPAAAPPPGRPARRRAGRRLRSRALAGGGRVGGARPEDVPHLRRRAALLSRPEPCLPRGEDGAEHDREELRDRARPGGQAGDRDARLHDEPARPPGAAPGACSRAHRLTLTKYPYMED